MKPIVIILCIFVVWNLITFLMMGIDKRKAIKDKQRISEKTLLLSAFCLGSIGVGAGMAVFHHKTNKVKFQVLVPLALMINGALIFALWYFIFRS